MDHYFRRFKEIFFLQMTEEKPDFTLINRLTVSIASHRVQLSKCDDMDQIDKISSSIFSMEQEILSERKKELKSLIKKKEEILQKMTILETSLDEVNREISTRVSRYRNTVTNRISQLEQEMNGKKSESPPLQSTQVNETQENP